jgi:superfamily II RNA helicase
VGLVVLDEVHYLGDPGRGSVWEEAIINCPRHIQLLAMSATVRNPHDLGGWISQVRQLWGRLGSVLVTPCPPLAPRAEETTCG